MDTVVGTVDAVGCGVGCWSQWVTSNQNLARRTVATQTEFSGISDSVYVSQCGECNHGDRKCHGIEERVSSEREANASNLWLIRTVESSDRESLNRIEKTARQCCFIKTVEGTS